MWRHDCSRKWPVDCGHESLCSGPHVERTKEQGHSDSHLLARQPRIELLLPAVCWRKSLWCGASTITPRFLSAQRSAPARPGSLHFEHTQWPPSGVLGSSQDCHPAGWKRLPDLQTLGHEMIYICNSCISSNLLQHLQQPSCPVNGPTSGCILGLLIFHWCQHFKTFIPFIKQLLGCFYLNFQYLNEDISLTPLMRFLFK